MGRGGVNPPDHPIKMRIIMILLTKLGGKEVLINERQIETAQETPDTVITMINGHTYIVTETIEEIMDKVVAFNKSTKKKTRLGD